MLIASSDLIKAVDSAIIILFVLLYRVDVPLIINAKMGLLDQKVTFARLQNNISSSNPKLLKTQSR